MMLTKPDPDNDYIYDYHEALKYIEAKYGYRANDYALNFPHEEERIPGVDHSMRPYQNFWHWVMEHNYEVSNGGVAYINFEVFDDPALPDFVRRILGDIRTEYGDFEENGELTFRTEW